MRHVHAYCLLDDWFSSQIYMIFSYLFSFFLNLSEVDVVAVVDAVFAVDPVSVDSVAVCCCC